MIVMRKYVAFGLYVKNEHGAHQQAMATPMRDGVEVCLAAEVDLMSAELHEKCTQKTLQYVSRIAELEQCGQECSEGFRRMQERIAELERASDIAIDINNDHQQRIAELERQLAMANDAAAKGEKARTEAAGMQERLSELELVLKRIGEMPLCYDSITTGCQGRQVHELLSKLEL